MTDFRLIELMAGIDDRLLARAIAPVPVYRKRKFKIALLAATIALLMLSCMLATPFALVIPYSNTHPEIEGGPVYIIDAMLEDEEHFLNSILPKSVRSALRSVFDALTGGDSDEPSGDEFPTVPPVEDTSEPPTQESTQASTEQTTEPPTEESTDHEHISVTDQAIPPTCQATGLSEGSHCQICLEILIPQNTIPKKDHQYQNDFCTVCGEKYFSQGLLYEAIPGGYKMVGLGTCTDTRIVVPATYKNQPVLSIGSSAFSADGHSNRTVTSIVLSDGIKIIEDEAFIWCNTVKSIHLPDSIESIGMDAFAYNSSLESIVLPPSITVIPQAAFRMCKALKSVTFRGQITAIENCAFLSCGIENLTLPDSIETIGAGAFLKSSLKSCNIPASLISLGEEAFSETALEEVVFGGNLSEIPANAFKNCYSLKKVVFNESIKTIKEGAFYRNSNLKTVIFAAGLTTIEKEAFCFCKNIISLDLPEGLVSIGTDAFRYSESLQSLTLPSTIQTIGDSAFLHCQALKTVTIPASFTGGGKQAFDSCGLETVVLEEGLEIIAFGMFRNCESLTDITFPASLTTIDTAAFEGCDSLVITSLPDSLTFVGTISFANCTFKDFTLSANLAKFEGLFHDAIIEELTIANGVTKIAKDMFAGAHITSIVIPEGVTEIGEQAFANCETLTQVSLPSTLTHIQSNAFSNCRALTSLELPEGLLVIGEGAFAELSMLREITLPTTLKELGTGAFAECVRLVEITVSDIPIKGVFTSCKIATVNFRGTMEQARNNIVSAFPYNSYVLIRCSDGDIQLKQQGCRKATLLLLSTFLNRLSLDQHLCASVLANHQKGLGVAYAERFAACKAEKQKFAFERVHISVDANGHVPREGIAKVLHLMRHVILNNGPGLCDDLHVRSSHLPYFSKHSLAQKSFFSVNLARISPRLPE